MIKRTVMTAEPSHLAEYMRVPERSEGGIHDRDAAMTYLGFVWHPTRCECAPQKNVVYSASNEYWTRISAT